MKIYCAIMVIATTISTFSLAMEAPPTSKVQLDLMRGAAAGSLPQIEMALRDGARINLPDENAYTPLHRAAEEGHLHAVEFLLNRRALIDARSNSQQTALHRAAIRGHAPIVSLLIARGANITAQDSDLNTPLHYGSQHGHATVVQEIAKRLTKDQIVLVNARGLTALDLATPFALEDQQQTSRNNSHDEERKTAALFLKELIAQCQNAELKETYERLLRALWEQSEARETIPLTIDMIRELYHSPQISPELKANLGSLTLHLHGLPVESHTRSAGSSESISPQVIRNRTSVRTISDEDARDRHTAALDFLLTVIQSEQNTERLGMYALLIDMLNAKDNPCEAMALALALIPTFARMPGYNIDVEKNCNIAEDITQARPHPESPSGSRRHSPASSAKEAPSASQTPQAQPTAARLGDSIQKVTITPPTPGNLAQFRIKMVTQFLHQQVETDEASLTEPLYDELIDAANMNDANEAVSRTGSLVTASLQRNDLSSPTRTHLEQIRRIIAPEQQAQRQVSAPVAPARIAEPQPQSPQTRQQAVTLAAFAALFVASQRHTP